MAHEEDEFTSDFDFAALERAAFLRCSECGQIKGTSKSLGTVRGGMILLPTILKAEEGENPMHWLQDETLQHRERLVVELNELTYKRERLARFIGNNAAFAKLPSDEQDRLRRQFEIMIQYEGVLQERIDHF